MPASPSPRFAAGAVLVALPWLNPFAPGPSPAVTPWILSMLCGLGLWQLALAGGASGRLRLLPLAIAVLAWTVLSHLQLRPEALMLAGALALLAIAASAAEDAQVTRALQAGLLAAACASAVMGIVQYLGVGFLFAPLVNPAQLGEAYANLRQPNQFATLCWMGAAVLLWGGLQVPRGWAMAAIALLAAGSAASASRTGMLQGALLTALAVVWNGPARRQRLALCATAAVAYFAATWLLPWATEALVGAAPERTLWGRLAGGPACTTRTVLWSNVLYLISLRPLTGWGWGELDYAHYMTLYPGARFCEILDNAHDLPLHLAVELGAPFALLATAGALAWAWRRQPWREQSPLRQLAWALVALVLLHSLVEYPLWYGPFQIAFGAALGWLLKPAAQESAHPSEHPARRSSQAIAAVLLAGTLYAGWDYARVSQIYVQPQARLAPWREDTLADVRRSWLFSGQARFAQLTLASVSRADAPWIYATAHEVLHYSPEPRVIERLIESATMLGKEDEAVLHLARYRAAFPRESAAWRAALHRP